MSKTLLPCPFCGGEGYATYKTNDHGDKDHHVFCQARCGGWLRDQVSEKKAISAWNRRAGPPSGGVTQACPEGGFLPTALINMEVLTPTEARSVLLQNQQQIIPEIIPDAQEVMQACVAPMSDKPSCGAQNAECERQLAQQAAGNKLPQLNDDLIAILGRPNFACAGIAQLLRAGGIDIAKRSENEQTAVIHFLLGHYLSDPIGWADNVSAAFDTILASSAQQEGQP